MATETSFNVIIGGEVQLEFFDEEQHIVIVYKKAGECFGFDALITDINTDTDADTTDIGTDADSAKLEPKSNAKSNATAPQNPNHRHKNSTTNGNASQITYNCIAVTQLVVFQLKRESLYTYWRSHRLSHELFTHSKITPITNYLKQINVFESITMESALMLASMFRWKHIRKDEILFVEGSIGEEFYVVAKGCVAVVVEVIEEKHAKNTDHNLHIIDHEEHGDDDNHPALHTRTKSNSSRNNDIMIGGPQLNVNLDQLNTGRTQPSLDFNNATNTQSELPIATITEGDENGAEEDNEDANVVKTLKTVFEFKDGEYFGEVSLVVKIPRTATIKAQEDTLLLELRKSDFQKLNDSQIKTQLERVAHERIAQGFRRYKIPLFNAVPLDRFYILSQLSQIRYFKKGDVICDYTTSVRALYVVAHGSVGVFITKQRKASTFTRSGDSSGSPPQSTTTSANSNPSTVDHTANSDANHTKKSNETDSHSNSHKTTPRSTNMLVDRVHHHSSEDGQNNVKPSPVSTTNTGGNGGGGGGGARTSVDALVQRNTQDNRMSPNPSPSPSPLPSAGNNAAIDMKMHMSVQKYNPHSKDGRLPNHPPSMSSVDSLSVEKTPQPDSGLLQNDIVSKKHRHGKHMSENLNPIKITFNDELIQNEEALEYSLSPHEPEVATTATTATTAVTANDDRKMDALEQQQQKLRNANQLSPAMVGGRGGGRGGFRTYNQNHHKKRVSSNLVMIDSKFVNTEVKRHKLHGELVRLSFLSAQATENQDSLMVLQEQFKAMHGWRQKSYDKEHSTHNESKNENENENGNENEHENDSPHSVVALIKKASADQSQVTREDNPEQKETPEQQPPPSHQHGNEKSENMDVAQQLIYQNSDVKTHLVADSYSIPIPMRNKVGLSLNTDTLLLTPERTEVVPITPPPKFDDETESKSYIPLPQARASIASIKSIASKTAENERAVTKSPSLHHRAVTALTTPSLDSVKVSSSMQFPALSDRTNEPRVRRKSEVTPRKSQSRNGYGYGHGSKTPVDVWKSLANYTREHSKRVRVADLMLPDFTVSKLKQQQQSRRNSVASHAGASVLAQITASMPQMTIVNHDSNHNSTVVIVHQHQHQLQISTNNALPTAPSSSQHVFQNSKSVPMFAMPMTDDDGNATDDENMMMFADGNYSRNVTTRSIVSNLSQIQDIVVIAEEDDDDDDHHDGPRRRKHSTHESRNRLPMKNAYSNTETPLPIQTDMGVSADHSQFAPSTDLSAQRSGSLSQVHDHRMIMSFTPMITAANANLLLTGGLSSPTATLKIDPCDISSLDRLIEHSRNNTAISVHNMMSNNNNRNNNTDQNGNETNHNALNHLSANDLQASLQQLRELSRQTSKMGKDGGGGSTTTSVRGFMSDDGQQYAEITISVLGAGNFFGETSLIDEDSDSSSSESEESVLDPVPKAKSMPPLNESDEVQPKGGANGNGSGNGNGQQNIPALPVTQSEKLLQMPTKDTKHKSGKHVTAAMKQQNSLSQVMSYSQSSVSNVFKHPMPYSTARSALPQKHAYQYPTSARRVLSQLSSTKQVVPVVIPRVTTHDSHSNSHSHSDPDPDAITHTDNTDVGDNDGDDIPSATPVISNSKPSMMDLLQLSNLGSASNVSSKRKSKQNIVSAAALPEETTSVDVQPALSLNNSKHSNHSHNHSDAPKTSIIYTTHNPPLGTDVSANEYEQQIMLDDNHSNTKANKNKRQYQLHKSEVTFSVSDVARLRLNKNSRKKSKKALKDKKKTKYKGSQPTFRCMTNCVIYSIDKQSLDEFFMRVPSARPWFDIMLSRYNVDLETVLHIPRASRYFTAFLESEYAEENIHYVLSVNEYKEAFIHASGKNRLEMARIIIWNFISDSGDQQINIAGSQKRKILKRLKVSEADNHLQIHRNDDYDDDGNGGNGITEDMFDQSQKTIYTLLSRDCFPRFKQSNFFQSFLTEAENLSLRPREEFDKMQADEEEKMRRESQFGAFSPKGNAGRKPGQSIFGEDLPGTINENAEMNQF